MEAALKNPFEFPLQGSIPLYVSQIIDSDFESSLGDLLSKLNGFQVRSFQKAPQKAKITRRLVYGVREVAKNVARQRIKFIVVAKDLDSQFIEENCWVNIKEECSVQDVPIVYGLTRSQLGKAIAGNPRVLISVIGVLNSDGAHEEVLARRKRAIELSLEWENQLLGYQPTIVPLSCIAAYYGHERFYRRLLDMKLCDAFISSTGDTDAHLAAARGFTSILRLCDMEQLLAKNYSLKTPLDLAVEFNLPNVILYIQNRLLVDSPVNIDRPENCD